MLAAQTPLDMLHCNEYVVPGTPVKTLVGLFASAKLPPAPLKIDQVPVPMTGAFAARFAVGPQTI